jgi:hypothetical protein
MYTSGSGMDYSRFHREGVLFWGPAPAYARRCETAAKSGIAGAASRGYDNNTIKI